jgi:hypothetical protein
LLLLLPEVATLLLLLLLLKIQIVTVLSGPCQTQDQQMCEEMKTPPHC